MTNENLNRQLMVLFLQELRERSSDLERNLLGLENAADREARAEFRTRLLRIAHSLKGAAGLLSVRQVEEACHRMEDLLLSAGEDLDPEQMDLLLAATDAIEESGRILERAEDIDAGPLPGVIARLAAARRTGPPEGEAAKLPSGSAARPRGLPVDRPSDSDGSVRVPAETLDSLLYQSGEVLVSRARARLHSAKADAMLDGMRGIRQRSRAGRRDETEEALKRHEAELRELVRAISDDGRQLQGVAVLLDSEVRKARMQPFALACEGLNRLVRDMSSSEGKSVEFAVTGGETEIDRSILGALHDSLLHLVRNAIVHGLEGPEDRRKAGKPTTGKVEVATSLQGERLQVTVRDDGRGIDLEAIRRLKGAAGVSEGGDEADILRMVFLPGVSTSKSVTRLSGRGIGLDVVRNAAERLRGRVDVSHVPGSGTAFTMTLPLTLATTRALLVKAGEQTFALDTLSVCRLVRITDGEVPAASGRRAIMHDGNPVPAIDLRDWLELPPPHSGHPLTAVILGRQAGEAALLVDEVTGEQELLVRPLGPRLEKVRGYNGGTMLPDGKVALLLNAAALTAAALARSVPEAAAAASRAAPLPKPRVLVAEDTLAIRSLEKLILEAAGYEVATAADGSEAWEHLLAHGADAVVADVDMPVMDGFALTRTIRGSERFRHLPVILVTARDTPHDKAMGMEAGADAYVTKSGFDQESFIATIRQVV
jgi:two-component system chemotaxis sensor kinase CheA